MAIKNHLNICLLFHREKRFLKPNLSHKTIFWNSWYNWNIFWYFSNFFFVIICSRNWRKKYHKPFLLIDPQPFNFFIMFPPSQCVVCTCLLKGIKDMPQNMFECYKVIILFISSWNCCFVGFLYFTLVNEKIYTPNVLALKTFRRQLVY